MKKCSLQAIQASLFLSSYRTAKGSITTKCSLLGIVIENYVFYIWVVIELFLPYSTRGSALSLVHICIQT